MTHQECPACNQIFELHYISVPHIVPTLNLDPDEIDYYEATITHTCPHCQARLSIHAVDYVDPPRRVVTVTAM